MKSGRNLPTFRREVLSNVRDTRRQKYFLLETSVSFHQMTHLHMKKYGTQSQAHVLQVSRLHNVAFPNTGISLCLCLSQLFPLPSSIVFIFGVNGFAVWRSIRRVVALTIPQGGHFSLSLSSTLPRLVQDKLSCTAFSELHFVRLQANPNIYQHL